MAFHQVIVRIARSEDASAVFDHAEEFVLSICSDDLTDVLFGECFWLMYGPP